MSWNIGRKNKSETKNLKKAKKFIKLFFLFWLLNLLFLRRAYMKAALYSRRREVRTMIVILRIPGLRFWLIFNKIWESVTSLWLWIAYVNWINDKNFVIGIVTPLFDQ